MHQRKPATINFDEIKTLESVFIENTMLLTEYTKIINIIQQKIEKLNNSIALTVSVAELKDQLRSLIGDMGLEEYPFLLFSKSRIDSEAQAILMHAYKQIKSALMDYSNIILKLTESPTLKSSSVGDQKDLNENTKDIQLTTTVPFEKDFKVQLNETILSYLHPADIKIEESASTASLFDRFFI